jgi:hypothetical protein
MKKINVKIICFLLAVYLCFTALGAIPTAIKEIIFQNQSISTEKENYKKSIKGTIDLSTYSWRGKYSENGNTKTWYNSNDLGDYNIHGLIINKANILSGNKIPDKYMSIVNEYSERCDIDWRTSGSTPCNAFHGAGNYIANLKYLNIFAKEIANHKDNDDISADVYYADAVARSSFSTSILNNSVFSQLSDMLKKILIENYTVDMSTGISEGEKCKYIVLGFSMHLIGDLYAHRLIVPEKSLNLSNKKIDPKTMFDPEDFNTDSMVSENPNLKGWTQFKADVIAGNVYFSGIKNYIKSDVKKSMYEDSPDFYPERFYEAIYSATCYLSHFDEDFNINILSPAGSLKLYNYSTYYNAVKVDAVSDLVTAIRPNGISLSKHNYTSTSMKSFMLTATVTPGYVLSQDVIWTSTDNSVATVNSNGKVVLKGYGKCSILATLRSNPDICGRCNIVVKKSANEFNYTVRNNGTLQINKYNWASSTIKIPEKIGGKKVTAIKSLNNFSNSFVGVKKIVIPSTVKIIKETYVDNLDSLVEIKVDSNNKNYSSENGVLFDKGKTALYSYPIGKSDSSYTVPSTVKKIMARAFSRSSLESVTLQNSVQKIGLGAFYFNRHLKDVTLSNKLTYIGNEAFCSTSIKDITVPSSVSVIGKNAIGYWSASGDTEHEYSKNFVITGKKYSGAYWYSKYNKISFTSN